MSANLGPEFLAAKKRHEQAITSEEKLAALEEMLATIPKHKATEKMQAQIKRQMSKLRKELKSAKKGPARKEFYRIDKEGAGQVLLAGPPNSGKSMLLRGVSKLSLRSLNTRSQPGCRYLVWPVGRISRFS